MIEKTKKVREGDIVSCQLRRKAKNGKKRIREFQAPSDVDPNSSGLAGSIQDVMARSEVVLAVQSITDKLQDIAEDLSTVEAKEVMPLLDSLTNAFGQQISDQFNSVATEQIRQLITAVQGAKSAIDKEVQRMKHGIEGGNTSDFGMDSAEPTDMVNPPTEEPGNDVPTPAPQSGGGLPEVPTDVSGNAEDDALGGGFAGRKQKESVQRRGKKLTEFLDASDTGHSDMMVAKEPKASPQPAVDLHPHHSSDYDSNLHNIGVFHGKAGEMARNIGVMIDNEALTGSQRKALANVLSHFSGFAHDPSHWAHAETKLQSALKVANVRDLHDPAVEAVVDELRSLAHFLVLKHKGIIEGAIRKLQNSSNPDALVLNTFRNKLAETRDAQTAAIRTARTFAIDIDDVVSVVREAVEGKKKPVGVADIVAATRENGKPVKEFQMHTPASAKGMFAGDTTGELKKRATRDKASIAASTKVGKGRAEKSKDLKRVDFAIRAHKSRGGKGWRHNVSEDAPLMTNNPIFPVGAGGQQQQPMQGVASPSTPPVGGPNQNPSTNKSMTPADLRARQDANTSQQQGAAARNMPPQPAGSAAMVTSGEQESGGQVPPTQQPQMAPVQRVNKRTNQFPQR